MSVKITARETRLLKQLLQNAPAWAAERSPFCYGPVTRSLANHHHTIACTTVHKRTRCRNITLLLAETTGEDTLVQQSKLRLSTGSLLLIQNLRHNKLQDYACENHCTVHCPVSGC